MKNAYPSSPIRRGMVRRYSRALCLLRDVPWRVPTCSLKAKISYRRWFCR